jgi:exopolysaccharide production protein ExoQ
MAMLMTSRLTIMKHSFARAGSLLVAGAIMFSILDMSFGVTEMIVTALGRNMTFTDRTPLWSILVELGMREPLFGYGYSGFWTTSRLNSIVLQAGEFNQGHNGYLEIFVEGGLVAIGLMTVLLLSVFRKIQKDGLLEYDHGVIRLTFFVVILLANVTESSFARERDLLTFLFFVIAATDAFTRPTDVKLAQSQIAVASRGHHIVGVTASAHRTRTGPSQTVWRRDPLPGSAVRRR